MGSSVSRAGEVFRIHRVTLWLTVFVALLLQTFLPLKLPLARLFDFPLLVTIYFALLKRNKGFAIGLGTVVGLLQDAFSNGLVGTFGMAKAVVGYLAASASIKFDVDRFLARLVLTAVLVAAHNLFLLAVQYGLLENPPAFEPLGLLTSVLVNAGFGLVLFQALDRFRQPA